MSKTTVLSILDEALFREARAGNVRILYMANTAIAKDDKGNTPLHYLAMHRKSVLGHSELAKVKNDMGITPLHVVACFFPDALKHPEISNVMDNDGLTPLHTAAVHNIAGIEKHPLFREIKDNFGRTPLDYFNLNDLVFQLYFEIPTELTIPQIYDLIHTHAKDDEIIKLTNVGEGT